EGGAYGAQARYDAATGTLQFLSYRDPNILHTLEVFEAAPAFLREPVGRRMSGGASFLHSPSWIAREAPAKQVSKRHSPFWPATRIKCGSSFAIACLGPLGPTSSSSQILWRCRKSAWRSWALARA